MLVAKIIEGHAREGVRCDAIVAFLQPYMVGWRIPGAYRSLTRRSCADMLVESERIITSAARDTPPSKADRTARGVTPMRERKRGEEEKKHRHERKSGAEGICCSAMAWGEYVR